MTSAFDMHAAGYDDIADSALGRELRRRVHDVITGRVITGWVITGPVIGGAVSAPPVGATTRALDIGCGSGIDTEWLARRCASVHAVDPSAAMIELVQQRCDHLPQVSTQVNRAEDFEPAAPFDLVLANFGAINCMGSLDAMGSRLGDWLSPGGHAVIVTMATICPLERLAALVTRNRSLWNRRRSRQVAPDAGYAGLPITYANARRLTQAFDRLELVHRESLGLALPPFEQRGLVQGRPRRLRWLARVDRWLAPIGGRLGWGDHIITVFRSAPDHSR